MDILHTTASEQLPSFVNGLREILETLTATADDTAAAEATPAARANDQPPRPPEPPEDTASENG